MKINNNSKGQGLSINIIIIAALALLIIVILGVIFTNKMQDENNNKIVDDTVLESDAMSFCNNFDKETMKELIEEKVTPASAEIFDIDYLRYEFDEVNNTKVMWSVTCMSDAMICNLCEIEKEMHCGCNRLMIKSFFNQSRYNDYTSN